MNPHVKFGSLIREYRLAKGWTQAELAEKLGYDGAQFVSLLERDESKCPVVTLGKLIVLLGIPEAEIVQALMKNYADFLKEELERGKEAAVLENKG